MQLISHLKAFMLTAIIACSIALASAQQPTQTPADDVVRTNTELVQTAFAVESHSQCPIAIESLTEPQ